MEPVLDTTRPHPARVYDYYLGGTDHFPIDRETGRRVMESWGAVRTAVRENRAFLGRAVRHLAAEAGIRQFLDIGAGLPSVGNVHEVAQAVAPDSRVVYVDNDHFKSGCMHTEDAVGRVCGTGRSAGCVAASAATRWAVPPGDTRGAGRRLA